MNCPNNMKTELNRAAILRSCGVWQLVLTVLLALAGQTSWAQRGGDPIWSPLGSTSAEQSEVYFRKSFTLVNPAEAQVRVEATGAYEVWLNSRLVHQGTAGEVFDNADVTNFVQPGLNVLAVRVQRNGNNNALKSYFRLRENGETRWRSVPSDNSWTTSESAHSMWQSASFPDRSWVGAVTTDGEKVAESTPLPAKPATAKNASAKTIQPKSAKIPTQQVAGPTTGPAAKDASAITADRMLAPRATTDSAATQPDNKIARPSTKPGPAPADDGTAERPEFKVPDGFEVQALVSNEECGSVIAMAFDEAGRLILSRETGGLIAIDLTAAPGSGRTVELCSDVTSCQGILPLNGNIYVTGNGPTGLGLYELTRIGKSPNQFGINRTLIRFSGQPGEHGPHGLTLGPDGKIYCIVGNGSQLSDKPGVRSPFRNPVDFDLVPRVEDPGGHATGVRAPGGTVVRVGLDGKEPEIVAGGIRNAYDLVFNSSGDLFVHDSDMESDLGMAWHRSTLLFHVPMGGDLGWRSGWSNCATHSFDTTPPLTDTGRGSPTGAVCYRHLLFPARYHDALFLADWSEGRIIAARMEQKGSSYSVTTENFLSGRPMNVTDLAIGEDGTLFFCTGGRGTWGGVFRVNWTGSIPPELMEFESDLARALRMPQPDSAWARQNLALLAQKMGREWGESLNGAALETRNTTAIRLRAIDTLFLYGGNPKTETLTALLNDADPVVRARTARMCGTLKTQNQKLVSMLQDDDALVRRAVCEALLDSETAPPVQTMLKVLADPDRHVSLAAMRLLQRQPVNDWFQELAHHREFRICLVAGMAALTVQPDLAKCYEVLAECSGRMQQFVNDRDFTDMLRLVQVALAAGKVDPQKIPAFAEQMKREFPAAHPVLNRELAKVLVGLRVGNFADGWVGYLRDSRDPAAIKTEVAMYLAAISNSLNDVERVALIEWLHEDLQSNPAGNQKLYIAQTVQRVARELTDAGCDSVLQRGAEWPLALAPVFYRIEKQMTPGRVALLMELDQSLRNLDTTQNSPVASVEQERMGIIALLAESGDENGMAYLRNLWREEEARRLEITLGLAQQPDGKNWSYLVASLPLLDDLTAVEIIRGLQSVKQRPVDARHYRDLIELAWRLGNSGASEATQLINHWADQPVTGQATGWQQALQNCTSWYQQKWPDAEPVSSSPQPVSSGSPIPSGSGKNGKTLSQVLQYLDANPTAGNPERGMHLFAAAKCADCHRFGASGDSSGPDLTSLASRFSRRETLEAIMEPNRVVPPQYRSTMIRTTSGQSFTGLKTDNGDDTVTLMQATGEKVRIAKSEIEEQKQVETSSMPSGLLDAFEREEIADLFAYMYGQTTAGKTAAATGVSPGQLTGHANPATAR